MSNVEEKTYYQMLGVERSATTDEIKEAYREIARVLHPDSNYYDEIMEYSVSGDQLGLFQAVTAAYHTLISKQKRQEYDATLPPELRGWTDEVDEQAEIDAKLVELGLKDPSEVKSPPKKQPKSAALNTFGKLSDEDASGSESSDTHASSEKERFTLNPEHDDRRSSGKVNLTQKLKKKPEAATEVERKFSESAANPHQVHATHIMGVGRASALSSHQLETPPREKKAANFLLYLLAVGVPFLVGIGLVAFLIPQ